MFEHYNKDSSNMASKIRTVLGNLSPRHVRIVDEHNHMWIQPARGIEITKKHVPNQYENILFELKDYKKAGGHAIVDCQPGRWAKWQYIGEVSQS